MHPTKRELLGGGRLPRIQEIDYDPEYFPTVYVRGLPENKDDPNSSQLRFEHRTRVLAIAAPDCCSGASTLEAIKIGETLFDFTLSLKALRLVNGQFTDISKGVAHRLPELLPGHIMQVFFGGSFLLGYYPTLIFHLVELRR